MIRWRRIDSLLKSNQAEIGKAKNREESSNRESCGHVLRHLGLSGILNKNYSEKRRIHSELVLCYLTHPQIAKKRAGAFSVVIREYGEVTLIK